MKQTNLASLLANLVSLQTDPEPPAGIDKALMSDVILGRRTMSPVEIDALWSSPGLSHEFLATRREVMNRSRALWQDRGFGAPAILRAAASDDGITRVQGRGWSVEIVRLTEGEWAISLTVSPEARAGVPPMAEIRLRDDGGMVWGQGRLADGGTLDVEWHNSGSPLDRLLAHRLFIALV